MRTTDQVHIVLLQKSGNYIRAEREGHTTIILAPSSNILIGIGPEEVAQETAVGNVGGPHHPANLLHRVQVRRQTTVHGKDLLVDDSGNRKAVKAIRKGLPELDVVPTLAFIVETVNTVDTGTLVVSTEDKEVLRILDLVREQKADGLQGLLATIDVIPEEKVVGLRRETTVLEEPEKIVILAVDITTNLDGRLQFKQNRLGDEDFSGLSTKEADLGFR